MTLTDATYAELAATLAAPPTPLAGPGQTFAPRHAPRARPPRSLASPHAWSRVPQVPVDRAAAACAASPTGAHRWQLAPPNGPRVAGVCRHCGAGRTWAASGADGEVPA